MKTQINMECDIVKNIILNVTPVEWMVINIALEQYIQDESTPEVNAILGMEIIESVMEKLKEVLNGRKD